MMTMTSDPAVPDAVAMLQRMHARAVYCANHGDVPRISSAEVLAVLRATEDERARHAEEVAALRDQLRRVEGERDRMQRANETLAVRMDLPASQLLMVGSELCGDGKIDPNDHRDPRWTPSLQQAAKVMRELTSLRSLLPDVRACAEYLVEPVSCLPSGLRQSARNILAALDSQGGEGE